jgi:hypothetical protein
MRLQLMILHDSKTRKQLVRILELHRKDISPAKPILPAEYLKSETRVCAWRYTKLLTSS